MKQSPKTKATFANSVFRECAEDCATGVQRQLDGPTSVYYAEQHQSADLWFIQAAAVLRNSALYPTSMRDHLIANDIAAEILAYSFRFCQRAENKAETIHAGAASAFGDERRANPSAGNLDQLRSSNVAHRYVSLLISRW